MDREVVKKQVLAQLRAMPDQDEAILTCACGGHQISPASLIQDIEQKTDEGEDFLDMYIELIKESQEGH